MASNQSSCVLSQAPIADNEVGKYIVSVENLVVNTDIPIFTKNTLAFVVLATAADLPVNLQDNVDVEGVNSAYKCYVGPVYSFLDFIHQVAAFCTKYNQNPLTTGTIGVDAQLASKKHFGLRGNRDFWREHVLYFPNQIGRIFDGLLGGEGFYHNYLHFPGAVPEKDSLWEEGLLLNDIEWSVNPIDYLYYNQNWDLGDSAVVTMRCKLDMFENRSGLTVDAVLPLPFELLCVNSNRTDNNKAKIKHGFLTLDFPEGDLKHRTLVRGVISDEIEIDQKLRTGVFQIVGDARNSVGKKLMSGQLQDHRYELLLVKKEPQADGTVILKQEPIKFGLGDYWSMDVVFTKQV
ncbi:MAG: hypothetical protein CMH98_00140 [Oceanospirillaceae bacterium]|nr:hypothetical protein [Oceanospirillaceae bacterium]